MSDRFAGLPVRGRLYVALVIAFGFTPIAYSTVSVLARNDSWEWLVLAALALLTGSFNIRIPAVPARISVSEAFVFTAVILYGAQVATLIVVLDALVMSWPLTSGK